MARAGAAVVLLAALAPALAYAHGAGTGQQSLGTGVCPRPAALRIEFGSWSEPRPNSPHEFFAAVSTRGGSGVGGTDIYASATPTTSQVNRKCKRVGRPVISSRAALRAPLVYRHTESGNVYFVDAGGAVTPGSPLFQGRVDAIGQRHAFGVRFACDVRQRVVVHVHALAGQGGHYLSVRTERSRKLLALANLRRSGDSSFRVSRACRQD